MKPQFIDEDWNYDYNTLLILTQAFIDTIRNSDNMNKQRLLIITGLFADLDMTFYEDFKLPIDPINKFAVSFIYNYPYEFNLGEFYEAINYNDFSGHSVLYKPDLNWGNDYL